MPLQYFLLISSLYISIGDLASPSTKIYPPLSLAALSASPGAVYKVSWSLSPASDLKTTIRVLFESVSQVKPKVNFQ
jgi:hypothetical protein